MSEQPTGRLEEDSADIESWLDEATPDEVRVPICMNRRLLAEFDALMGEYELRKPRKTGIDMLDSPQLDAELEKLEQRIVALRDQIEADERAHTYVFRKVSYEDWRELLKKFPPTEEQKAQYHGLIDFDNESAGPAVVAASCVTPVMTEEQAARLQQILPENVFGRLAEAAVRVNRAGTDIPKSVLYTVGQAASAAKSISAANKASPSPASTGAKKGRSGRTTTAK